MKQRTIKHNTFPYIYENQTVSGKKRGGNLWGDKEKQNPTKIGISFSPSGFPLALPFPFHLFSIADFFALRKSYENTYSISRRGERFREKDVHEPNACIWFWKHARRGGRRRASVGFLECSPLSWRLSLCIFTQLNYCLSHTNVTEQQTKSDTQK